ncbi:MAG: hypothetical protein JW910_16540, partial [Anaerolineae bacterium]|nr:hypothetical protein [Anaerolineae bacterium]
DIRRIEGRIEDVEALIEAAGGGDEMDSEDMAGEEEAGEEASTEDAEAEAGDEEAAMGEEEAVAALTLNGSFDEARDWTWEELEGLGTITATLAGPREDDPETEYTGVSLVALLDAAGVSEDAATLVATASDDFAAEIDLAAALECAECMIVQQEDGTLRLVMPDFPSNNWVSDVVSLEAAE